METLQIEIRNPKVIKLLNDLVELDLINIKEKPSFREILSNFPTKDEISLDEITKEVEEVRSKRYN